MSKDFICGAYFSDMSNVKEIKATNTKLPKSLDLRKNLYPVINQGSRGICCSVSMTDTIKYLENFRKVNYKIPRDFFYNNRKDKSKDGMTVKEAMEIAKAKGYIKTYGKLGNEISIKSALLTQGPVIVCTNVYSYDSQFWVPNGKAIGGHATVLVGYNDKGFILKNSWGSDFGSGGYSLLPYDHLKYVRELWTILY